MGVRVWKEVLCRGRQRDRFGNWFAFGPRDIAAAYRNTGKMLSRGVPIPAVWEHQPVDAGDPAEVRARYARHTFGHVVGRRINDRGNLDQLIEVLDPADVRQLAKTRFVSPKVFPVGFSDSTGGEYRGATISHVAATPTPVQTWQRPFHQLSRGQALYFSFTPEGPTVDDEIDDVKPEGGDKPKGKGELGALIDALRETGMNIPDEVKDLAGLIIAVKASGGAGGEDELPEPEPPEEETPPVETPNDAGATAGAGGGAPMLMSDARAEPLKKMARRDLVNRVKALFATGRVARPVAQKLLGQARAVELSFTKLGEPVANPVEAKVAAYEELPRHAAWKPTGRAADGEALELSVTPLDHPAEMTGEAELKRVIAEQERLAKNYSVGTTK